MFKRIVKRLALLIAMVLSVQLAISSPAQSAPANPTQVKEFNFVFLHGFESNPSALQLLSDSITAQLPKYILDYEQANPGTEVRVDTLQRYYPNDVDIDTWAKNIADSIEKHFSNKKNLILIGHSMGGKAALYAVAKNIGGLADKVVMVVTINSPIKSLQNYYFTGGGTASDYLRAQFLILNAGAADSVTYYDSSQDGQWVGTNKHWLAFISAESAPLSDQFNFAGVDPLPRDMDDGIIPISAQYADGADVIYYGEHSHSDVAQVDEVAEFIAGQILRYIFGGNIECSVFARSGSFEHKANWLLGKDYWEDIAGEIPANSGKVEHKNESYTKWQEWEDVVGERTLGSGRSSYRVSRMSLPFFTGIKEFRWLNPDDSEDSRLYIRTRAAPRSSVKVEWSIYQEGLLPVGIERDHYEIQIVSGTPLTAIKSVLWDTDNPCDLRLQIYSEAQSPFRWFKAEWKVYFKGSRLRQIINEIPSETLSGNASGS
jgi:pimeloyl-ACP methyl ester carboxylesterase